MNDNRMNFALAVAAVLISVFLPAFGFAKDLTFPDGTATPSETCGECHQAIYREFAYGFGSDFRYVPTSLPGKENEKLAMPASVSATGTAHAMAGTDPFPIHSREAEEGGKSCNVCHFPEPFAIPDLNAPEMTKPTARPTDKEMGGLTCSSCHLTPEGKIRGPHTVDAPHDTVADPAVRTSAMCAYCHSLGKRVEGKQTQTFLEWREDFNKPSLGSQHCQDCHMPRTVRKVAENYETPDRTVSRHLWTGGHSKQRLASAFSMAIVHPSENKPDLSLHVINIGAGHSAPTGSNRRAVYLTAKILDAKGNPVGQKEWMFAPWYGARPDDKKFLEEDKTLPNRIAASQADAQGPHEMILAAGEERVLSWAPSLMPGEYVVKTKLIYDLNRYNDRSFVDDQTEINNAALAFKIK